MNYCRFHRHSSIQLLAPITLLEPLIGTIFICTNYQIHLSEPFFILFHGLNFFNFTPHFNNFGQFPHAIVLWHINHWFFKFYFHVFVYFDAVNTCRNSLFHLTTQKCQCLLKFSNITALYWQWLSAGQKPV